MYERFTENARQAMQIASQQAIRFTHEYVGPEHILLGIVKNAGCAAHAIIFSVGVQPDTIRLEIEKRIVAGPDDTTICGRVPSTPLAKKVAELSTSEARDLNSQTVGSEHLLLALCKQNEGMAAEVLSHAGIDYESVMKAVVKRNVELAEQDGKRPSKSPITSRMPALRSHSRELFDATCMIACPGREDHVRRIRIALNKTRRNSVMLVGESSAGTRWVAETFAATLDEEDSSRVGITSVRELHFGSIVASKKPNETLIAIMTELRRAGNVALFIESVDTLLLGHPSVALDPYVLQSLLFSPDLRIIGTCTKRGRKKLEDVGYDFDRRFDFATVFGATDEEALGMLKAFGTMLSQRQAVSIADSNYTAAIKLSNGFLDQYQQPGAALYVLEYATSIANLRNPLKNDEIRDSENKIQECLNSKDAAIQAQDFEHAAKIQEKVALLREKLRNQLKDFKNNPGNSTSVTSDDLIQATADIAEVARSLVDDAYSEN